MKVNERREHPFSHFCLLFVCQNLAIALPSHLTWFLSRWPGIPVKHQKCYCYRTVVLTLQHASDSPARLIEIQISGPHPWSFSLNRRSRICISNKCSYVVDTAAPGPHFEGCCLRRREAGVWGKWSLIWSIIWTSIIYIFIFRQMMLSEVKYFIFDVPNLGSCTQFSHFV